MITEDRIKAFPLSFWQHIIAASISGVISASTVCPLDVVKTRLQAQRDVKGMLPEPSDHTRFKGTMDGLLKIAKYEGVFGLWRGLFATIAMTVPSTSVYFAVYERFKKHFTPLGFYAAPFLAGIASRLVTATITSPFDMIKTNLQSHNRKTGFFKILGDIHKQKSYPRLWAGLVPTLARDVPFSGIYWTLYEYMKYKTSKLTGLNPGFLLHFSSGAIAGSIAAGVTIPVDVIKTRVQMEVDIHNTGVKKNLFQAVQSIAKEEGIAGLTKGIVPRVVRVAPMCAITISSYELLKRFMIKRTLLSQQKCDPKTLS